MRKCHQEKKFIVKSPPQNGAEVIPILPEKQGRFIQHNHQPVSTSPSPKKISRVWFVLPVSFLVIVLTVFLVIFSFLHRFEATAGVTVKSVWDSLRTGTSRDPFAQSERFSFLLMGLDAIKNQRDGSLLTDTLMIATIDKSGRITLISLPRDLWIESLKTKINALYYYGEESNPGYGSELVVSVVEDITSLPIDGVVVVGMDTVKSVVDALGGIAIDIPESFTDTQFPLDTVNTKTVTDPLLLYETISFSQGLQTLSGSEAMKYIRSRHSDNEDEGNDMARVRRQQQVVNAIITAAVKPENVLKPEMLGSLFAVWNEWVITDVPDEVWISLGWNMREKPVTLITTQIPVRDSNQSGMIYHPPIEKYGLWVYEPVDPTWDSMQTVDYKNSWVRARNSYTRLAHHDSVRCMILFGVLIILMVSLFITKQWVQKFVTGIVLLLGGSPLSAIKWYSLLFLPGIIVHELSHFTVASLLGVRTGDITLFPHDIGSNSSRMALGSVKVAKTDFLRGSLIGAAPFFVGIISLYITSAIYLEQKLIFLDASLFEHILLQISQQPIWLTAIDYLSLVGNHQYLVCQQRGY
jgi:LCP family protein required for cell wall assembly